MYPICQQAAATEFDIVEIEKRRRMKFVDEQGSYECVNERK